MPPVDFITKDLERWERAKERAREIMSQFPPEVYIYIYKWLTPTELWNCFNVSRQWRELTKKSMALREIKVASNHLKAARSLLGRLDQVGKLTIEIPDFHCLAAMPAVFPATRSVSVGHNVSFRHVSDRLKTKHLKILDLSELDDESIELLQDFQLERLTVGGRPYTSRWKLRSSSRYHAGRERITNLIRLV